MSESPVASFSEWGVEGWFEKISFQQRREHSGDAMHIVRIFTGEDDKTYFEDVEIELEEGGPIGKLSKMQKATGVIFRETPAEYDYDWHNAPQRQYIIMLDAGVEITVGSGETRIINPGEVLLVEDTEGHGHISRALKAQPRKSVFITLD